MNIKLLTEHHLELLSLKEVSKGAKIRNRYNQLSHLTQDTNGKVTNSQLDTTNESQEVSPFPAGEHKAQKAAQAPLSLHLSKCHIDGNHMSRLISFLKESDSPRRTTSEGGLFPKTTDAG